MSKKHYSNEINTCHYLKTKQYIRHKEVYTKRHSLSSPEEVQSRIDAGVIWM